MSSSKALKQYADACFYLEDRKKLFDVTRDQRRKLHDQLKLVFDDVPVFAEELGLDPTQKFEVHALRRAMRISPDGRHIPQVVVALTQSQWVEEDERSGTPRHVFRGGSTLVVDLSVPEVKYRIMKNIKSKNRQEAHRRLHPRGRRRPPARALLRNRPARALCSPPFACWRWPVGSRGLIRA